MLEEISQRPTQLIKKGKATERSEHVASKLVELRHAMGKSQREFAEQIGVSFQQYQKYEKAKDRLSLEKAITLCEKIGISLDVFDGIAVPGFAEGGQEPFGAAPCLSEEEKEILAIFHSIPKKARANFLETVRQLGKMASGKN
jgi:transcriptional regulator with XRE-family HTH domain